MNRIQVRPEELIAFADQLRHSAEEVRAVSWRYRKAVASLDWEVQIKEAVGDTVTRASRHAEILARRAEELSRALVSVAQGMRSLDQEEARMIGQGSSDAGAVAAGAAVVVGAGAVAAVLPAEPAIPTTDTGPGSTFWTAVGPAPVSGGEFTAQFQVWANGFNSRVEANWHAKGTDHAGTVGASALLERYKLTPAKVERLWAFGQENHVDPRLLLAILQQEGTGSFNTNDANAEFYGGGHGPEPDFEADLRAAVQGPIFSKLRLYPKAVEGGFPGTWVQWVNWFTPMDTARFQGGAGVYAEDINWAAGVERGYREIASASGSTGDPVQEYSQWMGENSDLFQAKHITGDFVIKPGLAPGAERPKLALWGGYDKPDFPDTTGPTSGFWWFPAPDEYCWHIEKR